MPGSWRRWTHWNEGRRPMAQVCPVLGAGMPHSWRRWGFWWGTCAAKWAPTHYTGAGPHPFSSPAPKHPYTCGGPAPQNGLLRTTVAQVPTLFPHLRQHTPTPAPKHRHLHRVPAAPAPKISAPALGSSGTCAKNIGTCANIPLHLRHVVGKVNRNYWTMSE